MTKDSKVRTVAGLLAAALVLGTVAIGVADARQPVRRDVQAAASGHGVMVGGPVRAVHMRLTLLGLSDEQKKQVKAISQERRAELRILRERMRAARRAVADATANTGGEAAIRASSAELARVEADLAVFRADVRRQVMAVLTPEQQARAKALRTCVREQLERLRGQR
jgi:Spy/CpxP family protein refolding chaperone